MWTDMDKTKGISATQRVGRDAFRCYAICFGRDETAKQAQSDAPRCLVMIRRSATFADSANALTSQLYLTGIYHVGRSLRPVGCA